MSKIKLFLCLWMVVSIVFFPTPRAFSQETAMPVSVASEEVTAIEEKTFYVKPGNVTVNFKNADIRAVLRYLSEVSGVDIVPAPDVTGSITLSLTDKPWEVALDIIIKNYGYAYEREGDIIRVVTVSSLKLEELSTEVIPLNYTTAEGAQEAVKDMLTERGKLTFDGRVNALVVTDLATNIYKIKRIIGELDKKTPQIMIESKIIETVLNDTERLGIDWNLVISAAGATRPTTFPFGSEAWRDVIPHGLQRFFPVGQTGTATVAQGTGGQTSTDTLSEFPGMGAGGTTLFPFVTADAFSYGTLDFSQFGAVLEYLKTRADTDIISNPRITTLNNKSAKMFVGRVHPYISKIEKDEDTNELTYEYKEKEIGIRLLVTPHINDAGDIEVELKPEIKDVIGFQQITEFFSLPIFSTREAETQVMVTDGNTIFIGGLIKEDTKKSDKRFPILGDLFGGIPILGNAFRHEVEIKTKTELIFFLTVHVVKDLAEFNRLGARGITELEIPPEFLESYKEGVTDEVAVKLEPARHRKKGKPFIDFRNPKSKMKMKKK